MHFYIDAYLYMYFHKFIYILIYLWTYIYRLQREKEIIHQKLRDLEMKSKEDGKSANITRKENIICIGNNIYIYIFIYIYICIKYAYIYIYIN
jgi:hypothetical protein